MEGGGGDGLATYSELLRNDCLGRPLHAFQKPNLPFFYHTHRIVSARIEGFLTSENPALPQLLMDRQEKFFIRLLNF